jgi:hypothetical protein
MPFDDLDLFLKNNTMNHTTNIHIIKQTIGKAAPESRLNPADGYPYNPPNMGSTRHAPCTRSFIALGASLVVWIVLAIATGHRYAFFSMICGISGGYLYGRYSHKQITGFAIALMVFAFCLVGLVFGSVVLLSKELGISIAGIADNFGAVSLMEAGFENIAPIDWIFLLLGVAGSFFVARWENLRHRVKV